MSKREQVVLSVLIVLAMVAVFMLPCLASTPEAPDMDGLEGTTEEEVVPEEDPVVEEVDVNEGEDEEPVVEEDVEEGIETDVPGESEAQEEPVVEAGADVSAVGPGEAEDFVGSITIHMDDSEGLVFRFFTSDGPVCEFTDEEALMADGLEPGVYLLECGFYAACGFVVVESQVIPLEAGESKTIELQVGTL